MTKDLPNLPDLRIPAHVAVIMDGNGRWAKQRLRPRAFGHQAGVKSARRIVPASHKAGVKALTLFAFSQENWQRPPTEVSLLMGLFVRTLSREIASLHKNGVRIRFIGDHGDFPAELRKLMRDAEALTLANTGLHLVIAVGYGGQWDIAQAASSLCRDGLPITPAAIESRLVVADLPHPDLLIRTGGEKRLSNFLIWQLAYTELHLVDTLWPDFDDSAFSAALSWYASRDRRYGRVPEAS
ncbi:polyprenyl diphosphate synthase [Nevskia sp.]|uniref:polyprenyl diphosphate synthase n=1 Tax=Nevskia sp. TaxID=1929292 RepID=UPI0025E94B32|nr:polyprenyl diphosphate synthase [Nevskia sp.]